MIKINQLSKSYFARELFTDVTFQMNAGERLGLVGRNGHGKSTLFKLILGEEEADSGEIVIPRNYRIGHLEQHLHFTQPTILDEAAMGLPEEEAHSIYKAEAILFGLGFSEADLAKSAGRVFRRFSDSYQPGQTPAFRSQLAVARRTDQLLGHHLGALDRPVSDQFQRRVDFDLA